jgi:transposase
MDPRGAEAESREGIALMGELPSDRLRAVEALLRAGPLTETQAASVYQMGPEAVIFALLTLSAQAAGKLPSTAEPASTPSGAVPPYRKPPVRGRRRTPGRKEGHPGTRRDRPPTVDQRKEHGLESCPRCKTKLREPVDTRTRITEDIPEPIRPVVTEHVIHRYYCPTCERIVEAPVDDALPRASIGNHLLALTAWLHYGLGNTLSQIVSVLSCHLHLTLTAGALVGMWRRLAEILSSWYEAIAEQARESAVLHADETGWRVAGTTCWLWCFTSRRVTCYLIDRCRGSPVLKRFFDEAFAGILISDFWGAYNRIVVAARQMCLPHLFRDMKDVENRKDTSGDWKTFARKLKRLLRDALRLKRRNDVTPEKRTSRKQRFLTRLDKILARPWKNVHARRLVKRLRRHRNDLFTFVDAPDVPPDNNHAEREVRPAVIMRKNILCNRSEAGAHTQAVLMSVYRTLKLRGHNPIKTIVWAVGVYLRTGTLPPLPD